MLLTISYTGQNTTELGYLLHKNPYRPQVFELGHGKAYVFYPEISDTRTTVALLLDIDPLDLARGKSGAGGDGLFDYVNDRPYVSSSFLSTAIARVFGTAMTGRADNHQALSDSALDFTATVAMLPCRGEYNMLNRVFEPLGYEVHYQTFATDENFPAWGESKYVNLTIRSHVRLRDLLKHLYVLIPVFDRQKHYWVGADEVEKLLRKGDDWLQKHPEKEYIAARYLNRQRSLINMAAVRLASADADAEAPLLAGRTPEE
ncbi:MAG: 3' terminal RNA ribose 2'-O-methyltransferase Hen1, partial [Betaproteobacteria bacterium]|nr:3' terminal RNA ribose 2'-O-methyltransferase Hen1 [Betaproteobacteria bacterium]